MNHKMSKKILYIIIVILSILSIIFIRKIIDANTKFVLDSDNKYILDDQGWLTVSEGGLGTSNSYLEIDLEKKQMDYRYDYEYFDTNSVNFFQKLIGTKKRKLEYRYKLSDEITEELKEYFKKIKSFKHETGFSDIKDIPSYYYFLKAKDGNSIIQDKEEIKELKQILVKIDDLFS